VKVLVCWCCDVGAIFVMSADPSAAISSQVGASPRIYPRPKYISLYSTICQILRNTVWQSGVIGTVLTVACYPLYIPFYTALKAALGEYGNDAAMFAILLTLVHVVTYITINGTFAVYDHYGYYQEFKLSRKPYMAPKKGLIVKALLEAAVGQLVLGPIGAYYLLFSVFKKYGMLDFNSPLPTPLSIFTTFCIAHLFNGIAFYFAHRLFHTKALYATFHKQHHEFTGTIGIAAEYANPVEQIVANILPTLGGVMFFGTHPLCVGVWLVSFLLFFFTHPPPFPYIYPFRL
jgi:sterol desaturase/sphingolipid hydroxylase (fatty acid hydroxylase superfamily)